jgi:hypothetical protein
MGPMRNILENERYLEWVETFLCRTTLCGRGQRNNALSSRRDAFQPMEEAWPPRSHPVSSGCRRSSINSLIMQQSDNNARGGRRRQHSRQERQPSFADDDSGVFLITDQREGASAPATPPHAPTSRSPSNMIKNLYSSSPIDAAAPRKVSAQDRQRTNASSPAAMQQAESTKLRGPKSKLHSRSRAKNSTMLSPSGVDEIIVPTATHMGSTLQDQGQWKSPKSIPKTKFGEDISDEKSLRSYHTASTISTERLKQQLQFDQHDKDVTVADHMSVVESAVSMATRSTMTREMLCIAPDGEESVHVQEESEIIDGLEFATAPGLVVRRMRDGELEECDFENGYCSASSSNASF